MLDHRVQTFLAVCKSLNYTRAAEELHMTQPGVSQHIRYLEKVYGCSLLTYRNRKLMLTPEGETLHRAFLTMEQDTLALQKQLREGGGAGRVVRFGATLSIGEFLLPEKAAAFAMQTRLNHLAFEVANTRTLLRRLDEGRLDFALVEGNIPQDRYDAQVFREEPFIGVCGAEYPLGEIQKPAQLCRHPLVLREDGSGTKDILERLLEGYGYTTEDFPRVFTVSSPYVIKQFLRENLGISFLYRIVAEKELEEGTLREFALPGVQLTHAFRVVWRRGSLLGEDYRKTAQAILTDAWEIHD